MITLRSLQQRLEYAGYRFFRAILLRMSHLGVRRMGSRIGRVAYYVDRQGRTRAYDNLELVMPELGHERHEEILRRCFRHFGESFSESVSVSRFTSEELLAAFDVQGWEHIERLQREGRHFFLMSGHFGCFEIGALYLGLRLGGLQVVARPPNNEWVRADLEQLRRRFGNQLIAKRGASHRMLNAHRRGHHVAIMVDHRVRPSAGIRVPFLGTPAWSSPILAFLSNHSGSPVVPIFCEPADEGRYLLRVGEPIEPLGRGDEQDAALTRRYLEVVELEIRRRPELWMWMHRRWRDA